MIKILFIDIDNTLLSFEGYVKEAMRDGFKEFNLAEYDESMFDVFERINSGLWKQHEQGTLSFEELKAIRWSLILKELGIDFDGVAFEKYFRDKLHDSAIPEAGANELLEYLSEKYVLCAASNGPYEQQLNRLKVGGMLDKFKYFFISEKVGAQKPSEQFFARCFDVLRNGGDEELAPYGGTYPDLKPEEVMIIGDSISADITGGREYGLATCLYKSNGITPEDEAAADYVVAELLDIKKII